MKILCINQYYWPEHAATSQHSADLFEHLAASGHSVTVLCSRGRYDDPDGTAARLAKREVHKQVDIRRVQATGLGKTRMAGRVLDYLSFHLLIGLHTLTTGARYDMILTMTAPPLIGLYATAVKLFSRVKHVCWVMDLHPDCEFELGIFSRRSLLPRALDALNGLHFRRADHNITIGGDMKRRLLAKGVPDDRITEIPVWGHAESENNAPLTDNPLQRQFGLEGKFVVMYSGNAGLIHSFDEVCQAALTLRDDPDLVFLFVGGGKRTAEVAAFKDKHQLQNIHMHGYVPREQLGFSLALGDVHLITMRPGTAGVALPSKIYGVMAAGRPVIYVGPDDSTLADTVRDTGCGVSLPNGAPQRLVETVGELRRAPHRCQELGRKSREAYDRAYNPQVCCEAWRVLLEKVAGE